MIHGLTFLQPRACCYGSIHSEASSIAHDNNLLITLVSIGIVCGVAGVECCTNSGKETTLKIQTWVWVIEICNFSGPQLIHISQVATCKFQLKPDGRWTPCGGVDLWSKIQFECFPCKYFLFTAMLMLADILLASLWGLMLILCSICRRLLWVSAWQPASMKACNETACVDAVYMCQYDASQVF